LLSVIYSLPNFIFIAIHFLLICHLLYMSIILNINELIDSFSYFIKHDLIKNEYIVLKFFYFIKLINSIKFTYNYFFQLKKQQQLQQQYLLEQFQVQQQQLAEQHEQQLRQHLKVKYNYFIIKVIYY